MYWKCVHVFTAISRATHTKSYKIQNLTFFKSQLFQVVCLYVTRLLHNMFQPIWPPSDALISSIILMHLVMAKYAETCYAVDCQIKTNNWRQLSLKIENFSVSCTWDGSENTNKNHLLSQSFFIFLSYLTTLTVSRRITSGSPWQQAGFTYL
jgi:hypothetical protein